MAIIEPGYKACGTFGHPDDEALLADVRRLLDAASRWANGGSREELVRDVSRMMECRPDGFGDADLDRLRLVGADTGNCLETPDSSTQCENRELILDVSTRCELPAGHAGMHRTNVSGIGWSWMNDDEPPQPAPLGEECELSDERRIQQACAPNRELLERVAELSRSLAAFRRQIERDKVDIAALEARNAALVAERGRLAKLREGLGARGDNAYCNMISVARQDESLGWEAKVNHGKFGRKELDAHIKAGELLGRHRALAEVCADIDTILSAVSAGKDAHNAQ